MLSKGRRKDAISVISCYLVNSAIMYNMEIMIKMSFAIKLILTAILNIVFNFFPSDLLNVKSNVPIYKDTSISEKK